jgi:tetratricopeptide (TPR) repeat protein
LAISLERLGDVLDITLKVLAAAGLFLYATVRLGIDSFYRKFEVTAEEVGLNQTTIIGRAAIYLFVVVSSSIAAINLAYVVAILVGDPDLGAELLGAEIIVGFLGFLAWFVHRLRTVLADRSIRSELWMIQAALWLIAVASVGLGMFLIVVNVGGQASRLASGFILTLFGLASLAWMEGRTLAIRVAAGREVAGRILNLRAFEVDVVTSADDASAGWLDTTRSYLLLGQGDRWLVLFDAEAQHTIRIPAGTVALTSARPYEWPQLREAAAAGLFRKAYRLAQWGDPEGAVALYEEVDRRFGDSERPGIREYVALALFNRAVDLGERQDQTDSAMSLYDELDRRFGADKRLAVRVPVARALRNKAHHLEELSRTDEAEAVYDTLDGRFGYDTRGEIREQVAMALFEKAMMFGDIDEHADRSFAVYDELSRRFAKDKRSAIRQYVAEALLNKALDLAHSGDLEAAITVFDELDERFGSDKNGEIRVHVAVGLLSKGIALGQLDRLEDEIVAYGELDQRFALESNFEIRSCVAAALLNMGIAQGEIGRGQEAIAIYETLDERFGAEHEPEIRAHVVAALRNEGVAHSDADRLDDAIALYEELDRRFGADGESEIREHVAVALLNRGVALQGRDRHEDAVSLFDDLDRRFGADDTLEIRELVGNGLSAKVESLQALGLIQDSVSSAEDVLARFKDVLSEEVVRRLRSVRQ